MKPVRRKTAAAVVVETGAVAAAAVNGAGIAGRRTGSTYLNQRLGRLGQRGSGGIVSALARLIVGGLRRAAAPQPNARFENAPKLVCIPGQAD
jgi:hypothetical protein